LCGPPRLFAFFFAFAESCAILEHFASRLCLNYVVFLADSDFTPDKLDGRTWQQTYDAMVGRDASLDKYMAYGDSALAILDEYDLSVHHKIERWEAMEKLFSEQRLV
jgi:hypothetical protein